MGYEQYDSLITPIATKLSGGDLSMRETLRSEMNLALVAFIGEVNDPLLAKILTEVAEAYLRGYRGKPSNAPEEVEGG